MDIAARVDLLPTKDAKEMNISLAIFGPATAASSVGEILSRQKLFLQESISHNGEAKYFNPHDFFIPDDIRLELEREKEDAENGVSNLEIYKCQEDKVFRLFEGQTLIRENYPTLPLSSKIKTSLLP